MSNARTTPALIYPTVITEPVSSPEHITVTYSDTTTDDVTIDEGTYYALGDGTSDDLLQALADALTSGADGDWTVAMNAAPALTITITKTGGSKTPSSLTFLRTELTAQSLGLTTDATSPKTISGGAPFTGAYRARWCWTPEEIDLGIGMRRGRLTAYSDTVAGVGSIDTYELPKSYTLHLPVVRSALVLGSHTALDEYANAVSVATSDPNAALDLWLSHLAADLLPGDTPILRYLPDVTTPATSHAVRLPSGEYYASEDAWTGGALRNDSPAYYDIKISLKEAL